MPSGVSAHEDNLLNIDHDGQVQEMIDLAEVARRCPQPVQHWIVSWREGEQPTRKQADEAVGMFLAEMGLADHQAVYALHRDTHNCHAHVAVNRVHPSTEKVVTVNNGFDLEVAVRMAVTGHSREQIATAIFDGARASRPHEDRDWQAYARRAVQRAFSAPGEQARARLALLRDKLLRLEGRQDERQLL